MPSLPTQNLLLCVDRDKSSLHALMSVLREHYDVLTTSTDQEAIKLAFKYPLKAVILACTTAAASVRKLASEIKEIQPQIPIIIFTASWNPTSDLEDLGGFVDNADGPQVLIPILHRLVEKTIPTLPVTRRFPRYRVRLPMMLTVHRFGKLAGLKGTCTSFGEGGIGGTIDGDLKPSEYVLVSISDPRLEMPLQTRAQVRYCRNNSYGLAFFEVTHSDLDNLRRFCQQLH